MFHQQPEQINFLGQAADMGQHNVQHNKIDAAFTKKL